jgi:ribulose-phosphate 3-epimerase
MKRIIPAIIAKSQQELDEKLEKVKHHSNLFQLDVMNEEFVQNSSMDFDFKLPQGLDFEAHLMINNPMNWIQQNLDKVVTAIVHIEACDDPENIISIVKEKGKKIGFALNPETQIEKIRPFLEKIDQVLILTVHPGFYGGKFVPEALGKVKELRNLNPNLDIEVDGGINQETIRLADEAGANLFVSGSFIMESKNAEEAISALKKEVKHEHDRPT